MKTFSKRIMALMLVLVLVFASCANAFAATGATTYEGKAYHQQMEFGYNFKYSDEYLISGNNEIYSTELSKLCLIASNAQYKVPEDKQDSLTYGSKFYTMLGFTDVQIGMTKNDNAAEAYDYKENLTIAHKLVTKGSQKYELIIVAASGTENSDEWISNVDIGAENDRYISVLSNRYNWFTYNKPTTLGGLSPNWTDYKMHKGFCVSANMIKKTVDSYVSSHVDSSAQKIILITGHSRSGALANILGTFYEADENYKSFTYTFASPNTTTATEEECKAYKTIFNIVNEDDVVAKIPMATINFRRYGVDLITSGLTVASAYKDLTNKEYIYTKTAMDSVYNFFVNLVPSRESYYTIDKDNKDRKGTFVQSYNSEEECKSNLSPNLFGLLASVGSVFNFEITKTYSQKYTYTVNYSPAYLLTLVGIYVGNPVMLANLQTMEPMTLFSYINSLTPIGLNDALSLANVATTASDGSMQNSHATPIYYLLACNDYGYDQEAFLPNQTGSIFSNNFYTIPVVLAVIAVGAVFAVKKSKKTVA